MTRTYVIAGPGTRMRERVCSMIRVGSSGNLELWLEDRMIESIANGGWASFWEKKDEQAN